MEKRPRKGEASAPRIRRRGLTPLHASEEIPERFSAIPSEIETARMGRQGAALPARINVMIAHRVEDVAVAIRATHHEVATLRLLDKIAAARTPLRFPVPHLLLQRFERHGVHPLCTA